MNITEIILTIVIVLLIAVAIAILIIRKKKGKCSCGCNGSVACAGCSKGVKKYRSDLEAYILAHYEGTPDIGRSQARVSLMSASFSCAARESVCFDEDKCTPLAAFNEEIHSERLEERIKHLSDSFAEYFLYLIEQKGMTNAQVYKRALVDKKTFSKLKNNPDYHPNKITAMCLCVGACLNMDETRDMLARAGYALSPCDMRDVIFSFFIENEIYDMIEIDIQLEEHGLDCLIS